MTNELVTSSIADTIIHDLTNLGYICRKDSNRAVSVYAERSNRIQVINQLIEQLPEAQYNPHAGTSSLGLIYYRNGSIRMRPLKKSKIASGVENETILANTINYYIEHHGMLNIAFIGNNSCCVNIEQVRGAVCTGSNTQDRKKGDIELTTGNRTIPISIKKRNAEYWESADSYYGTIADSVIEHLASQRLISLEPIGKYRSDGCQKVKVTPEIAVKASKQQTLDIVFGNDLFERQGFVVKETFTQKNFRYSAGTLTITVDTLIDSVEAIPKELAVYMLIRNDSTRNRPQSKYPGLRVLGAYASRAKNALILDHETVSNIIDNKKGP